jgi:hypothetical protein
MWKMVTKMVGVCLGSLVLFAGIVGVFGLSRYKGKSNERKRKKLNQYQETQTNELTA